MRRIMRPHPSSCCPFSRHERHLALPFRWQRPGQVVREPLENTSHENIPIEAASSSATLAFAVLAPTPLVTAQTAPSADTVNALKAQAEHFRIVRERGEKPFYAPGFDSEFPAALPAFQAADRLAAHPRQQLHRRRPARRILAEGLVAEIAQPGMRISYYLPTSAGSFGALDYDQADVIFSHRPGFYDLLAYERMKNCDPVEIAAVTGSYDVGGWENSFTILVNGDNPLKGISIEQLDGVFGAARDGGWVGTNWRPDFARGPEKNIRTWGQLGLTGEWADQPIHVYGFSLRYNTAVTFCDLVLKGSDKWNEKIHAYGNYMAPDGKRYVEADQITEAIGKDKYAIGFNRFRGERPNVRRIQQSATATGPAGRGHDR